MISLEQVRRLKPYISYSSMIYVLHESSRMLPRSIGGPAGWRWFGAMVAGYHQAAGALLFHGAEKEWPRSGAW